jgi:hypothetical protein
LQPKLVLNKLPGLHNAPFAAQKEERQGRERKRRKKSLKNI